MLVSADSEAERRQATHQVAWRARARLVLDSAARCRSRQNGSSKCPNDGQRGRGGMLPAVAGDNNSTATLVLLS